MEAAEAAVFCAAAGHNERVAAQIQADLVGDTHEDLDRSLGHDEVGKVHMAKDMAVPLCEEVEAEIVSEVAAEVEDVQHVLHIPVDQAGDHMAPVARR